MKKSLVLTICFIILTFGANAFALVAYDQTYSYNKHVNLNPGNGNSSASFSFTNLTDNFIVSATTPYPSLSLNLTGSSNFSDTLLLNFGDKFLATITTENPTYVFDAETLSYLNSAIINESVSFSLVRDEGTSTLRSARLTGTIVPEPASLALICAGLVALPFARRLRKAIRSQFQQAA
ncbi:MAG: PEP-CTERM sorting domain-containing protein [Steroidobacteraceae bacterium]|nr:PEP-CTERM sorting domain-containing protein [Deltaproteobacteria bacterium]